MATIAGRVRALHRQPSGRWCRIERRLDAAGMAVDGPTALRRAAALLGATALGGSLFAGEAGAVAAPLIAMVCGAFWLRRRLSGRIDQIAGAFPDAMRATADAVRAGLSLSQAVDLAADEAPQPLREELRRLSRSAALGEPFPEALRHFTERCPVPSVSLFAGASTLALRAGADLAPILDGIVDSARESERIQGELRAASAQGRLTAMVVGGLPIAFLLVLGAGTRAEIAFLTREPPGWALLAVGALLETTGFLWIRGMVKPS